MPGTFCTDGDRAPIVELRGITKRFGDLVANDAIDLAIRPGEVHALLGENGAGKSTLTKIVVGLSRPDDGDLLVDGTATRFASPKEAIGAGIGVVTQEFSLVGPMTVTDNLLLGSSPLGPLDRAAARRRVIDVAERIGIGVDPDAVVESLSVGERQRVEILKALVRDCRVLMLDEPTAVLTPQDSLALFDSIRTLRADGMAVVLISHKLHEVMAIADRVTVIRRGRVVTTRPAADLDPDQISALMIGGQPSDAASDSVAAAVSLRSPATQAGAPLPSAGAPAGYREASTGEAAVPDTARSADDAVPGTVRAANSGDPAARSAAAVPGSAPTVQQGNTALTLDAVRVHLDGVDRLDVSLAVAAGEIVGVAGVSGNGQTELIDVLAGVRTPDSGRVTVGGTDVGGFDPLQRHRAGLGLLTDDRRGSVIPRLTVEQNLVIEDLGRFRRFGFTDRRAVRRHAEALIAQFDIRAAPTDVIATLSGGNIQKVLLARALSRDPAALVVAQPTRGLDVGAYAYVHGQLRAARDRGAGVLVVSEDLDELFVLADRIVVLYAGSIVGTLPIAEATVEAVGRLMTGHRPESAT